MDTPELIEWRNENPVDYIKGMNLLLETPVQDISDTFMEIYKYTRLYIPNVLFKYFSLSDCIELNDMKIETLRNQLLHFAEIRTLNDPFDSKAFFYNPESLKSIKRLKKCNGRFIEDFSDFHRITSFTSCGTSSLPMWAHYSNNHQGYCIVYDMTDERNVRILANTFPIQYTNVRVDLTVFMKSQVEKICAEIDSHISKGCQVISLSDPSMVFIPQLLSYIKNSTWSYEQEFRCSIGKVDKQTHVLPAFPKEIYIGLNCSEYYAERLTEIGRELGVPVYKMVFDDLDTVYDLRSERVE